MRIILQPYQSIREASVTVGLPPQVLRRRCRDGTVPYIRHNGRFYIDIPALLDVLDADDSEEVHWDIDIKKGRTHEH